MLTPAESIVSTVTQLVVLVLVHWLVIVAQPTHSSLKENVLNHAPWPSSEILKPTPVNHVTMHAQLVMEHSYHNVVHVMMVTYSKEQLVFQDVSKEATYSTLNALPV